MAHKIINNETGRAFAFESEAAWETAMDWYNATPKAEIIKFCELNGLALGEPTGSGLTLIDDWAEAAMELFDRLIAKKK